MKPDESFPDIGDLLRSQKPDPHVPSALEGRILRALDERKRPAPRSWWPWLVLPPAFAAIALLCWPRPAAPETGITSLDSPAASLEPVASLVDAADPLTAETTALSRDAERAGAFLSDCMPSFASQAD